MKRLTYYHLLILVSWLFYGVQVKSQNQVELSLDKAVNLAIKNNWDVKKMEAKLGMEKANLMQANASFLPSINLSETYINTTDPLNVFGFKLKQEIISVTDFNPSTINNPDDINNFMTKVQVYQPIFNADAFSSKSAAAANSKAATLKLKWTKNLIGLQAKYLYFQLLLINEQEKVLISSQQAINEAMQVTQDYYNQDLIAKVDMLEMQLRVNEIESQLLAISSQVENVNAQFAHFLGYSNNTTIKITDQVADFTKLNIEMPDENTLENRSDMQALAFQLKAANQMLTSAKFKFLPRLNAFGSYEWNDKSAFGTNAQNYMVGARLEWDIFSGGKNVGNWQKMKYKSIVMQITYDEKLSKNKQELEQLKRQLPVAKKQVELAKLAVEQAKESFKLISDRYKEGLEKTADVLKAEATLSDKKVHQIININQYQQLLFQLEMLLEKELINQY